MPITTLIVGVLVAVLNATAADAKTFHNFKEPRITKVLISGNLMTMDIEGENFPKDPE